MTHSLFKFSSFIWLSTSLWFILAFLGIEGLITPWTLKHGIWFWISLSLLLSCVLLTIFFYKRIYWSIFMAMSVSGTWLWVQFESHWKYFFYQASEKTIHNYYQAFDTWFLIGPYDDKTIPDAYHLILQFLLLIAFLMGALGLFQMIKNKSIKTILKD